MTFLATTRVAIIRGTTENALGDEVESNGNDAVVTALRDLPACLVETTKNVYDPATATRRTVRLVTCRVPAAITHPDTGAATPVQLVEGDRVRDNVTGRIYAFNEAKTVPRALSGQSSLTLDLRATASA